MAFCWRADDGATLNAGLVALWFFRGSRPVLLKYPIFSWFFRGVRDPLSPPLDLHMWSDSSVFHGLIFAVGQNLKWGAQWLSGRVFNLRSRGHWFEPHLLTWVVLVQPRKHSNKTDGLYSINSNKQTKAKISTVKTLYYVTHYNRIFNIRHKIAGNKCVSIKIPSL